MRKSVQIASLLVGAVLLGGVSLPTWAVDGVILIDQNKAMAGGVTPGDAPGFPVTISLPGSYRLAGNLTVPAGVDGIQITANNVTLDLNGFQIAGPGSGSGAGAGVNASTQVNIAIVNGMVFGMGDSGIVTGQFARVEKVQANNSGGTGIAVGAHSFVSDCVAHNNNGNGIFVGAQSVIQNNDASFNGTNGVFVPLGGGDPLGRIESATVVRGNTANHNLSRGIVVIVALVSGNNASLNSFSGIEGDDGVFTGNLASGNGGDGLTIGSGVVTGNTAHNNGQHGLLSLQVINGTGTGYKGNNFAGNAAGNATGTALINLGDNICGVTLCP